MPTVEEETARKNALLLKWHNTQARLSTEKTNEAALRKQVIAEFFVKSHVGTNTAELGKGYLLKAAIKQTYSITKDEKTPDTPYSHLPHLMVGLSTDTGEDIIKWKPSLNEKLYKELDKKEKSIVNKFILIKDATPSLTLVEPKTKE